MKWIADSGHYGLASVPEQDSTVTFGSGQYEIHTVKEYVDLEEFANACRLAVALARLEG